MKLPLGALTEAFIGALSDQLHETTHNSVTLSLKIYDAKIDRWAMLRTRRRYRLTPELLDFLQSWDEANEPISFELN